jgi:hypothetical protein
MKPTAKLTKAELLAGAKNLLAAAKKETDLKQKAILWNRAQVVLHLAGRTDGGMKRPSALGGDRLH